jgi:flagellar motor switch protein FliM
MAASAGRAFRTPSQRTGKGCFSAGRQAVARSPPERYRSALRPDMNQQILSQNEVDALLQGITGESQALEDDQHIGGSDAGGGVRDYDLASQERIVRGRMPTMEIINERFARNIRIGLFNLIRKSPEISIGGIKVQKYSAFLREIVVPTNFNIVSIKPLRGSGLIVCDPTLVFAVIDALFGGAGKFHTRIEGRDFSPTEQRVILRLLDVIIEEYKKAWVGIYPLEFEYQRSEMQPQFANIATPSEIVVATSFTLEVGDTSGTIHFCVPYSTLEPIRDVLYSTIQGDSVEPDRRWINLLKQQIQAAEVELVAELATAQSNVEQLLAFKAGDFIELDLDPAIQAKVDGVPLLDCHYGTSNGKYAIKIDRLITSSNQGWLGDHHVS